MNPWYILAIVITLGLYLIRVNNRLIHFKNQVKAETSSIDAALVKRLNLITHLVTSLKAYMKHEKTMFLDLMDAPHLADVNQLSHSDRETLDVNAHDVTQRVQVILADFPDLRSSELILSLQNSLESIEEELFESRQNLVKSIQNYNTAIESFPAILFAKRIGHLPAELYTVQETEKRNVNVGALFQKEERSHRFRLKYTKDNADPKNLEHQVGEKRQNTDG